MKITSLELHARLMAPDADDIVDEVLSMSPGEVRSALRDLGYHLPTLHAKIRRRAGMPAAGRRGFIKVSAAVTGVGGVGAILWTVITSAAPMLAPMAAHPPANDTTPAVTVAAPGPSLETPDAGTDGEPTGDKR